MASPLEKEISGKLDLLRNSFNEGYTLDLSHRRSQLTAFKKMMIDEAHRFRKALNVDLRKHADEANSTEISMVLSEIQHMLDHLEEYASPEYKSIDPFKYPVVSLTGHARAALYPDPLGVVMIMGAWNYPIHLTLAPLAGAIAAGNTVMLMTPSMNYCPESVKVMQELIPKYLDNNCVQVIVGGRQGVAASLLPSCKTHDLIFFTGGSFVGKMVAKAAAVNLTPTVLELGGQNPVIIDKNVNIHIAAYRMMWAKSINAGQTCIGANHVFIHDDVADEFLAECKKAIREFFGTNAEEIQASTSFPRIVNKRAHVNLVKMLEADKEFIIVGGQHDESDLYIAPTIMDFGRNEVDFDKSASMVDEIFGPILPFLRFRDIDKIIKKIQGAEKPLALYIFTNDSSVSERVLSRTSAGQSVVNDMLFQMVAPLPFGGIGRSGMGSYHYSFDTFTHSKAVLKRHCYGEIPARYPPYGVPWKTFLLNVLLGPYTSLHVTSVKMMVYSILVGLFWVSGGFQFFSPFLKELLEGFISYL